MDKKMIWKVLGIEPTTDEEEIKASIEAIRNCLSETSYSCAFGYAMNNHDEDISKIK